MKWAKPEKISKKKIDLAGNTLISSTASEKDKNEATNILNNWRAIHSYPMHVFKVRLKRKATGIDKDALTAQRLKRVPAIINKLKRSYGGNPPTMRLSQMQDIGGCRAVLTNVSQARTLFENYYLKGQLKHKRVAVKDYITHPKKDGYRSIHVIYSYFSDKEGKKDYNGLLVEIQIRSKLQHLWATAIETVDLFTKQAIKSNEGQAEWIEFFRLVSSAFAKMEDCPRVPNTPKEDKELYSLIKQKADKLNVIELMKSWTQAIKIFEETFKKTKAQYFLLELDVQNERMTISVYEENEEEKAIFDYAKAEEKNMGKKYYDVVLVGVDNINELKRAYPNYFVDSKEFLQTLKKIIKRA